MEHELPLGVARVHAIEDDEMIVHVKVDARSAPLNEVDRAALRSVGARALGAGAVEREDALDEEVRDGREHLGLERHELAQVVGQGQYVLPQGHIGQHAIDQKCARVGHAPARATRADAAAAAGEGDQQVVATCIAVSAREALAEHAAFEVRAQLLLDVAGQAALVVLASVGEERFEMLANEAVQDGLRRPAGQVRRREGSHEGPRAWRSRAMPS